MKQETLQYFKDIHLTQIGMAIFMVVFLLVVLWVFRSSSKNVYDVIEKLPLEDGHE